MIDKGNFGIIAFDLSGGDAAIIIVDEERWTQIKNLTEEVDASVDRWKDKLVDLIGFLTDDELDSDDADSTESIWTTSDSPPPIRKGKVLSTVLTQTFCPELVKNMSGTLIGILTFP